MKNQSEQEINKVILRISNIRGVWTVNKVIDKKDLSNITAKEIAEKTIEADYIEFIDGKSKITSLKAQHQPMRKGVKETMQDLGLQPKGLTSHPKTYTREQVINLIEDFTLTTYHIPLNSPERKSACKKWIEQNL